MTQTRAGGTGISKSRRERQLLIEVLKLATFVQRPMREQVAEEVGLSVNEVRLLMCLKGEGALAGQELAEIMGMSAMNVSRALAALSEKQLVLPVDNADNRRRKPVHLTAAGEDAFDELQQPLAEVAAAVFSGLTVSEQQQLQALLARVVDNTQATFFED